MARAERKIADSSIYRLSTPRKLIEPAENGKTTFDPMAKLNQAKEIRRSRRGSNE